MGARDEEQEGSGCWREAIVFFLSFAPFLSPRKEKCSLNFVIGRAEDGP